MTPSPQFTSIHDILLDLHGRVVRIETMVDASAKEDLSDRVSRLETAYKVLASVGTILVFIATFLQDAITSTLGI